jgi:hypothetical protein
MEIPTYDGLTKGANKWIPAFAGMTGRCGMAKGADKWIPACAGMTSKAGMKK